MDKEIHIKFENGSEIKTIPCDSDNVRGKRAEEWFRYFRENPWVLVHLQGVKLSLWQKLMLKYWWRKK